MNCNNAEAANCCRLTFDFSVSDSFKVGVDCSSSFFCCLFHLQICWVSVRVIQAAILIKILYFFLFNKIIRNWFDNNKNFVWSLIHYIIKKTKLMMITHFSGYLLKMMFFFNLLKNFNWNWKWKRCE